MNTVVLLGTAHTIQRGDRHATAFRAFLKEIIEKYNVRSIAEESHSGTPTVARTLASALRLDHRHVDPNIDERIGRGIPVDISFCIWEKYRDKYPELTFWPPDPSRNNLPAEVWQEYETRTSAEHRLRESFWIEKIADNVNWPLLFICGANHFDEFATRLEVDGYHVQYSYKDWEPQQRGY